MTFYFAQSQPDITTAVLDSLVSYGHMVPLNVLLAMANFFKRILTGMTV